MKVFAINNTYKNPYQTGFKAIEPAKNQLTKELVNNIVKTEIKINNLYEKKNALINTLYSDKNYTDTFWKQKINFINKPEVSKKNLDKVFPGYSSEKCKIRAAFINNINRENKDDPRPIPASIVVYGNGTITKPFLTATEAELDGSKVIIKHPKLSGDFITEIQDLAKNAREDYFKTQKRTVVIFDKPEKYFSIMPNEANLLGINLDTTDKNILSNNKSHMAEISFFKSFLDEVSKLPEKSKGSDFRSALTFIMTTENPHLIHPDLIQREGKMMFLNLGIPRDDNLKEIILNSIDLPKLLSENISWDMLLRELNPNSIKGGLSIKNILQAVKNSEDSLDYISNLISSPRDIPPKTCARASHINKNMGIRKTKNEGDSINLLIHQKNMGLLSPNTEKLFNEKINQLKNELEELNEIIKSGHYGKKQLYRREQIQEILEKI